MGLPKEKLMLHVCLTFRHHYTSRPHFGRDITPYNGSIKRVQVALPKTIAQDQLELLSFLKPCHLMGNYNCVTFLWTFLLPKEVKHQF